MLEFLVLLCRRKAHSALGFDSCRVFVKSIEVSAYIYVHEHWRLVELPWDSPWTWLLAFLGVDLGYYWAHRMAHGEHGSCGANLHQGQFTSRGQFTLRVSSPKGQILQE